MSTAQRRGGKQSKLAAWQQLVAVEQPVTVQPGKVEPGLVLTTENVQVEEPEPESKVELKPIVKKSKLKTDGD